MALLVLLLLLASLVCFLLAAFGVPTNGRISLGWLGLAFAAVTWLIANWPASLGG